MDNWLESEDRMDSRGRMDRTDWSILITAAIVLLVVGTMGYRCGVLAQNSRITDQTEQINTLAYTVLDQANEHRKLESENTRLRAVIRGAGEDLDVIGVDIADAAGIHGPIQGPTIAQATDKHPDIEDELTVAMVTAPPRPANSSNVVGSPAQDLRAQYAAAYHRAHLIALKRSPACEGCGITAEQLAKTGGELNTHHVDSVSKIFEQGLDPALVGDPNNLMVFCRNGGCECHFCLGHDPDGPEGPLMPNWGVSNDNVRRDAARHMKTIRQNSRAP